MDDNKIHVVLKEEHHALNSCPCFECVAERERRATSLQHPLHCLSVDAARAFGFVGPGLPEGSLARRLMNRV